MPAPVPLLGELERAVMACLWDRAASGAGPATVREVHESVGQLRGLAYTTVMTVLDRLAKKQLVTQARDGRAFRYAAQASREELTARAMRETLGGLSGTDRRATMLHFLDQASPEELADLRAALAEVEHQAGLGVEPERERQVDGQADSRG
ncbi:MAG TPA: BlaI/MecI/CopY family transcriptional regulator [Dermatophilaceae bacterium]|nr:BlaI/MecI/CopY family transcriptional regulator [Dermatophilaceae bacterium]